MKTNQDMDTEALRERVRMTYAEIARGHMAHDREASPDDATSCGCCGNTTVDPVALATTIGYSAADLSTLPEGVNMGLACGNPTATASLNPGEVVLDLGSGGDFDLFLAGRKVGVGTSVNWPVGLGGKGNEGVAGQIKQTTYSIGYVELIYAIQNKLPYGKVRNSSGNFAKADLASVTAAAAGVAQNMPDDFRVSITNAPGTEAYPISSFTWLLFLQQIQDPTKKKVMTDFLHWMLTEGQNLTEALAYARLPEPVVTKELRAISRIQ